VKKKKRSPVAQAAWLRAKARRAEQLLRMAARRFAEADATYAHSYEARRELTRLGYAAIHFAKNEGPGTAPT